MTNDSRPLIPVNPEGLDDIAESLLQNAPTPNSAPVFTPSSSSVITNPEKQIILPGATYGNYGYSDTLVAMDKTHFGKNWQDSHVELNKDGNFMLFIRQFVDFLNLLRTGKAYDGNGRPIDKRKIDGILDEIYTVRSPWRREWVDAKFEKKNPKLLGLGGILHINYEHKVDGNGNLKAKYSEPLADYLMNDKTPGIDLGSWLTNANKHGLPKANILDGQLYYWYPRNGAVTRFDANSGRAGLDCYGYPTCTDSSLGVRAARAKN